MTDQIATNLALAKKYEETYNTDVDRFVTECYTPDCTVNGGDITGYEQFLKVEKRVLRHAPRRQMRVDHTYATGDVVVVQAVVLDPDQGEGWSLPFCAVLTCRDGRIASDWTYAEFSKWPGLGGPSL